MVLCVAVSERTKARSAASALDESTPHEYGCGWGLQSGPNPHNRGHPPMNKQGIKKKWGQRYQRLLLGVELVFNDDMREGHHGS